MSSHVVPKQVYYRVFAALLVLLVLTVAAAGIEHRVLGIVVAITIAVTKAVLIMMYFMHLRYTMTIARIYAIAGFVWLALLLMFTASDYITRV